MSVIRKEISIRAPRNVVWRYLSDADLLAAWLMRNNFSGVAGEKFNFFAQPWDDWNGQLNCSLLEYDPPNRIAFTWDANTIGADTIVTIELQDRGEETGVLLIHANFEHATGDVDRLIERHAAGWTDHLSVLKSQAEEDSGYDQTRLADVDWSRFELHVAIQAESEQVLRYRSTIHGMEGFFVQMMRITGPDGRERDVEEPGQPGDDFVWRWHNGLRVSGKYLSPGADDEVRFTFGESKVAVCALPYRGGSLLRLRQYDIPAFGQQRPTSLLV